ncbi:MAG: thioesterase domain-containing protein [Fusobacterium necrophorum]|nr:thioesterase domain-containing protein [Fusobacterium necrophorum]
MIKIFALPGAGSSAITYYRWMPHLPSMFVISPLDLPGRGMKIKENKILENKPLIEHLYMHICKKMTNQDDDYVLVGNSFSSILAIQLCKKIEEEKNIKNPEHLFLAVEPPPNILQKRKKMSEDIKRKDFVKSVIHKFFEDRTKSVDKINLLVDWILEKLYNDKPYFLQLNEKEIYQKVFISHDNLDEETLELLSFILNHLHIFLEDENVIDGVGPENLTISTDIDVFGAIDDEVASEQELKEWEQFTNGKFGLHMFSGEHTILYDNPSVIINKMKEVLDRAYE